MRPSPQPKRSWISSTNSSLGQAHEELGEFRPLGPHDRRQMRAVGRVGQRQHGEGAGGQEALVRDPAMRLLVADRADERFLPVFPAQRADTCARARGRGAAVARDGKARLDRRARRKRHARAHRVGRDVGDRVRGDELHARFLCKARIERAARVAVLDDVAERIAAELAMVVMQEEFGIPVRHADVEDRFGMRGDPLPQADAVEQAGGAQRDRRAAAVEGVARLGGRVVDVDDGRFDARARQRQRQRQPHEAAADDRDIGLQGGWHGIVHDGHKLGRRGAPVQPAAFAPALRFRECERFRLRRRSAVRHAS